MLPIRSTAETVSRYTGGYIAKHMQNRHEEDKGIRLVRNGKGMHWARSRIAFNSPRVWLWREKLKMFALQKRLWVARSSQKEVWEAVGISLCNGNSGNALAVANRG
jgi:hypothetical protein